MKLCIVDTLLEIYQVNEKGKKTGMKKQGRGDENMNLQKQKNEHI